MAAFRALWFFIKLGLLAYAISWLLRNPGEVAISIGDWQIQSSFAVFAALALGFAALLALIAGFWRGLYNLPFRWRYHQQQRGLRALTNGFIAVAAGDADAAARQAKRADKFLGQIPLKNLLSAQAAQMRGDKQAAAKHYVALMADQDTSFLGLRGLLQQAAESGKYDQALRLARQAQTLQPKSPSVLRHVFELEARLSHFADAQKTLKILAKRKILPAPALRENEAALKTALAQEAENQKHEETAFRLYKEASAINPDLIPAQTGYLTGLFARGRNFLAERHLARLWEKRPHPDLHALILKHYASNPRKLEKLLRRLSASTGDHPQTKRLAVDYALSQNLWGLAGQHLQDLLKTPQAQDYRLLQRAYGYLPRDQQAPLQPVWQKLQNQGATLYASAEGDESWICDSCHISHGSWTANCKGCKSFNSLYWGKRQGFTPLLVDTR